MTLGLKRAFASRAAASRVGSSSSSQRMRWSAASRDRGVAFRSSATVAGCPAMTCTHRDYLKSGDCEQVNAKLCIRLKEITAKLAKKSRQGRKSPAGESIRSAKSVAALTRYGVELFNT